MPDHFLLRSQRNDVFEVIREEDMNPAEFDWSDQTSRVVRQQGTVPQLIHKPTKATFLFDFDPYENHHYADYIPGLHTPRVGVNAGDWSSELSQVRQWLRNIKREFESPDLWAQLSQQGKLLAGEPAADYLRNEPFTTNEQHQIAAQLREIEAYIRAHELNDEQLRAVEGRLNYLEAASGRMGRIDWRNAFVGVMLSLAVESIVPPDLVREGMRLVLQGVGHLFGGFTELPMGPPG